MMRPLTAISLLAFLSACGDGQPFFDADGNRLAEVDTTGDIDNEVEGDGGDIDNDGASPPPGTDNPELNDSIFRYESSGEDGGGLVTQVSYNRDDDTFFVDNLAFDGANVYQRNTGVRTLNGYRVFAADEETDDFLTGTAVSQIVPYRAIYGVSSNRVDGDPRTSFAVVRTGGYVNHGFGGYVYERTGGAVLPETGQATFSGDYAGVWTLEGEGGLAYVSGDMRLDIDFEDFNENAGIKGRITDRVLIDENNVALGALPNVNWVVEEGVMTLDENGEIVTNVFTVRRDEDGALSEFFTGTFTGLVAGDLTDSSDGGEIVGIIEMDASAVYDPVTGFTGLTGGLVPDGEGTNIEIKETGGTILDRD